MSDHPAVDVADYLPAAPAHCRTPWPHEARSGRHATRYGLYAFASHAEYPETTRIRLVDSLRRIHLSVWLNEGIHIRAQGRSLHVGHYATMAANFADDGIETTFCGRNHHVGLLLDPDIATQLDDAQVAAFLSSLQHGECPLSWAGNPRVLRAAHELDTILLDATSPALLREAKSLELLARMVQAREQGPKPPAGRLAARLHQARDLLLADLANPPTIAELAVTCGLNSFSLKQGFKALFGSTIHGFYQQERMRRAWQLIESGQMSVSDAGAAVGYTNLSHFGAAFRQQFGMLPSALKRR